MDQRPWFRCPFGDGLTTRAGAGRARELGYRNVHWHVETPRTGSRGGPRTRSGTTPSRARWSTGTAPWCCSTRGRRDGGRRADRARGLRAGGSFVRDGRRARGAPVSRAALVAVDGGGSKVDAVVVAPRRARCSVRRGADRPTAPREGRARAGRCRPSRPPSAEGGRDPRDRRSPPWACSASRGADLAARTSAVTATCPAARLDRRAPCCATTRSPCCGPEPTGRGGSASFAGSAPTARPSHPTAGRTASRRSAGSPATGAEAPTSARRPCGTRSDRGRARTPNVPRVRRRRTLRVPAAPAGDAGDVLRPGAESRVAELRARSCSRRRPRRRGRDLDRRPPGGRDRRDGRDGHPQAPDDRARRHTSSSVAGSSGTGSRRSSIAHR